MHKFFALTIIFISCVSCSSPSGHRSGDAALCDSVAAEPSRLTLLFVGDLMQHITQIKAAACDDGTYDYADCFRRVRDEIRRADVAVANLEVTLGGKPYRGYPLFSAPDEYLMAIRDAGFDVLLTANNHALDRGARGLQRTIHMLDSLGLQQAGTYVDSLARTRRYPLMITQNGWRVALLNYTYGTNGLTVCSSQVVNYIDRDVMARDIAAAKAMHPDVVIACMHWGDEYRLLPNAEQRELADWLLSQGVHHIVGAHPHVVQPLEVRTDSLTGEKHVVAYSLGNFLSNMSRQDTDGGLMLRMTLEKDSCVRLLHSDYLLTWVSRPDVSGHKVHRIYRVDSIVDTLNAEEQELLRNFSGSARRLFEKHNRGIEEYAPARQESGCK